MQIKVWSSNVGLKVLVRRKLPTFHLARDDCECPRAVSQCNKPRFEIGGGIAVSDFVDIIRGVDLCQTLGGPNPFPPDPYPLPSFPSLPFLRSLPSLCPPFPSLPSPSSPLPSPGGPGAMPPENFFRYTCSHASFSAFLTQKSAVYLTRFPDNNFAFLQ
jgi:hypothetical protein